MDTAGGNREEGNNGKCRNRIKCDGNKGDKMKGSNTGVEKQPK